MRPKHTVEIFIAPANVYRDKRIGDRQLTSDRSMDKFISSVKSKNKKRYDEIMEERELAKIEEMFI